MAKSTIATGSSGKKQQYEEKLFRDTQKEFYFSRFMGESADSLIQVNTSLEKSKGDDVRFGIVMRLTGDPIIDGTLEGNEQKLTDYYDNVTLHKYRFGVRHDGEMSEIRPFWDLNETMKSQLKVQGGEYLDTLAFNALAASPTKIFYGGTATSTATVAAADKLTPAMISKIKTWALTGGNRAQTPLRPIRINGKNYIVLLVHPDVMYDLKQDSTFAQARREAEVRGKDNPIFSGSEGIWDGVVIHEHENIGITTNWGAGGNVAGAKCTLMGAQSLMWAWGRRPKLVEETFDYGDQKGIDFSFIAGVKKPKFNSKDYGSIGVYVARTQISDAS